MITMVALLLAAGCAVPLAPLAPLIPLAPLPALAPELPFDALGSPSPRPEAAPPPPAAPSRPSTTRPTPTTTPSPAPLTPADAADGTDVAACQDGVCEVLVTAGTTIPTDPGTGVTELRITAISAETVIWEGALTRSGSLSSNCMTPGDTCDGGSVSLRGAASEDDRSTFRLQAPPGYRTSTAVIDLDVVAVRADAAVVALVAPAAADGGDVAACADGTCSVLLAEGTVIPLGPDVLPGGGELRIRSVPPGRATLSVSPATGAESSTFSCGDAQDDCDAAIDRGVVRADLVVGGALNLPEFTVGVRGAGPDGVLLELSARPR